MHVRSIVNVLGFTTILFVVSACGAPKPQPIQISAKPVEKPELVLPGADRVQTRKVDWYVVTAENFQEQIEKLKAKGKPIVFFALTDEGYEALALNLSDLRAFIQQQQAIIVAYEGYYKDSNSALEAANAEIAAAAEQATQSTQQQETALQRLNPFN